MKVEVPLRIVLVAPPAGVVYGIQRGSAYEVAFEQRPTKGLVTFEFALTAAEGKDGGPSCATVTPIGGWKVVGD